jgi:hypothetical protein
VLGNDFEDSMVGLRERRLSSRHGIPLQI